MNDYAAEPRERLQALRAALLEEERQLGELREEREARRPRTRIERTRGDIVCAQRDVNVGEFLNARAAFEEAANAAGIWALAQTLRDCARCAGITIEQGVIPDLSGVSGGLAMIAGGAYVLSISRVRTPRARHSEGHAHRMPLRQRLRARIARFRLSTN